MQVFGHAGITLGVAVLLAGVVVRVRSPVQRGCAAVHTHAGAVRPEARPSKTRVTRWLGIAAQSMDLRVLLFGSLLPDMIDKPVGQVLLREVFSNGRIFSHSLLFLLLVTALGFWLYRRAGRKKWALTLSLGTATHLVLDQMWATPGTFLWPAYGFAFEKLDVSNWVFDMIQALLTDPAVYTGELVGAGTLVLFALQLARMKSLSAFVRYGQVNGA